MEWEKILSPQLQRSKYKQNWDAYNYTYLCHSPVDPEEYPKMFPKAIQDANIAFAALFPKRPNLKREKQHINCLDNLLKIP